MSINSIFHILKFCDRLQGRAALRCGYEKPGIVSFLFHGIVREASETETCGMLPQQGTSLAELRSLVRYYQNAGYTFVRPEALSTLKPGKYALLTFDDGYFNNTWMLPLLEEFQVPAVFFISSLHVREGKAYWWDALYRARRERGVSLEDIQTEIRDLKRLRTHEVEYSLFREFGAEALRPLGEADRPMTSDELRHIAAHPLVCIGNHTADHAILPNYTVDEQMRQIQLCQEHLQEMANVTPTILAYPNGKYTAETVHAAASVGISWGCTVRATKTYFPLPTYRDALELGRFAPRAERTGPWHWDAYRCDCFFSFINFAAKLRAVLV